MSVQIDLRWVVDGYSRGRIRTIKDVEYTPGSCVCHIIYAEEKVGCNGMIIAACPVEPGDIITNLETGEKLTANMPVEEKYKRIKAWLEENVEIPIDVEDIIL